MIVAMVDEVCKYVRMAATESRKLLQKGQILVNDRKMSQEQQGQNGQVGFGDSCR